ncbi:MAG: FAD-dependent oxidoreductase, partial [Rhodospirillaceae bacterium]|nr:FAD-dependent oxidoreductase [Rhodospirillaceae bacterium]
MTGQKFRNAEGGLIDRAKPLNFTFDGKTYQGFQGDTLASALLANGVRVVGRSFKYHRPRGVLGAGFEEPNALVQLGVGARTEPNMQATRIELFDGLTAASQNRWPSLNFDIGAINGLFHRLLPPGFYYKTFMAPAKLWMTYEKVIRRAAGMGRAPTQTDPDVYARRYAHCDVLVVGGGPAGLSAALAAGRSGARVILAEDKPTLGGQALESLDNVTVLTRTMAAAYYDHNLLILSERVAEHKPAPAPFEPRQRLWQVRAQQVVLATGALERPLVFTNNDRPGVMLASAAQRYANEFAVRAGNRAVIFTNNDSAYDAAHDLMASGIDVAAIIDARPVIPDAVRNRVAGTEVLAGHAIVTVAAGRRGAARGVTVKAIHPQTGAPTGWPRDFACDLVAMSGGWNPTIHLFSQSKGKIKYDADIAAFTPDQSVQQERSAGAANGTFNMAACIAEGGDAGAAAARDAGFDAPAAGHKTDPEHRQPTQSLWIAPTGGKRF